MKLGKAIFLCAWISLLPAFAVSAQSIVGAWTAGDTTVEGASVLVFLANGCYFQIQNAQASEAPHGFDGFERGTYTWNPVTGALTVTTVQDLNGDTGLSGLNGIAGLTFVVSGDAATVTIPGEGTITGTRVTGASPIVGAWSLGDAQVPNASGVVVFMPNGVYFEAEDGDSTPATGDPSGHDGIEHGTYTWNPTTGLMTSSRSPAPYVDTNGEWGLSHTGSQLIFLVSADGSTLNGSTGPSDTFSLTRVGAAAVTKVTVVEYRHAAFDHYFITPVAAEIALLDAHAPPFQDWSRTGFSFNVYPNAGAPAGSVAICRFFNDHFFPKSSHFYAAHGFGCEATIAQFPDWGLEDDKLFNTMLPDAISGACPAGTIPVYRMYNQGMGNAPNHRFVTSLAERQKMIGQGFAAEGAGIGVGMCVPA